MRNPGRQGPPGSEFFLVIAMIAALIALFMPVIALAHSFFHDIEQLDRQQSMAVDQATPPR